MRVNDLVLLWEGTPEEVHPILDTQIDILNLISRIREAPEDEKLVLLKDLALKYKLLLSNKLSLVRGTKRRFREEKLKELIDDLQARIKNVEDILSDVLTKDLPLKRSLPEFYYVSEFEVMEMFFSLKATKKKVDEKVFPFSELKKEEKEQKKKLTRAKHVMLEYRVYKEDSTIIKDPEKMGFLDRLEAKRMKDIIGIEGIKEENKGDKKGGVYEKRKKYVEEFVDLLPKTILSRAGLEMLPKKKPPEGGVPE